MGNKKHIKPAFNVLMINFAVYPPYFLLLLILFFSGSAIANNPISLSHAHKIQTILLDSLKNESEIDIANSLKTISYLDGFGRPLQSISLKASPLQQDIVMFFEFDPFGRVIEEHLPFPDQSGIMELRPNPKSGQQSFYNLHYPGDSPLKLNNYESSPISRLLSIREPGNPEEKTIKFQESSNKSNDLVIRWIVTGDKLENISIYRSGHYSTGELLVKTTEDEDGYKTCEFIDRMGRTLMVEGEINVNLKSRTYYIYDDHNQLLLVISPEGEKILKGLSSFSLTHLAVRNLCYTYIYDYQDASISQDKHFGLLIKKRLPGSQWVEFAYDNRKRIILTKDGVQDSRNTSTYNVYDNLNRLLETGLTANINRPLLKTHFDNYELNGVSLDTTKQYGFRPFWPGTTSGNWGKRTQRTHGLSTIVEVSSMIYSYDFSGKGSLPFFPPQNDILMLSVSYYDEYGRIIQTISDNHLGKFDIVWNRYNFAGELVESIHQHNVNTQDLPAQTLHYIYEFDHAGRLISTLVTLNGSMSYTGVNQYDQLGRLNNENINSGFHINTFQYNIRNWLTGINQHNAPIGDKLFSMQLFYGNHPNNEYKRYNGNISGQSWLSVFNPTQVQFNYKYDGLNRLTQAVYDPANHFSTSYQYDLNGNIRNLKRRGPSSRGGLAEIDNLDYFYGSPSNYSNMLIAVDNKSNSPGPTSYDDRGSFGTLIRPESREFYYDLNGNMIRDINKRMIIYYNHLNLPVGIKDQENKELHYFYDALGRKLRQQAFNDGRVDLTRDYVGPFVYTNNVLSYILTPNGRFVADSRGDFFIEYHLKDHLGNTRISFAQGPQGEKTPVRGYDYYPFGHGMHRPPDGPIPVSWVPDYGEFGANRYLFQGKELQDDFGLNIYDFHARGYMADLGRTWQPDPHAENYYGLSPYSMFANNPIRYIDPDGRDWYEHNGNYMWRRSQDEIYKDNDGNEWKNIGTSAIFFHGNTATYFGQNKDDDGNLSLSSQTFNLDSKSTSKDFVLGMQSSDRSRAAAQKYWDEPTLGNWVGYLAKEVLSQWTNPELLVAGATVGVAGMSSMAKAGTTILEGAVKSNYGRFVKSMPANAKSNATFRQLRDGNFLFEATSPGNVPGSKAVYLKWVNPQGETFKMIKTTFAPDGSIIHVKPKF